MLNPADLNDLLESSDVVGNIRFSHPTLYVFPGGQGDAALFGINGFNMLGELSASSSSGVFSLDFVKFLYFLNICFVIYLKAFRCYNNAAPIPNNGIVPFKQWTDERKKNFFFLFLYLIGIYNTTSRTIRNRNFPANTKFSSHFCCCCCCCCMDDLYIQIIWTLWQEILSSDITFR